MTPLQQHMIEDMSVRGLVPSTQRAYLRAVRDLTAYYKRSPDTLSTRDIQRYLCMLHEERGLTYSTCNTIVHGLRFFYGTTLGRSAMHFVIPLAKEPSTLPVILSRHDIRQLLAAAESLRDQTLLKVTYNAGLRASEVVHLKIAHIDSHRMCLRVAQGKRQKDREALLSSGLLQDLRKPCHDRLCWLSRLNKLLLGVTRDEAQVGQSVPASAAVPPRVHLGARRSPARHSSRWH